MTGRRHRVLAIGLDSAEPALIEDYLGRGYLPAMARLRKQGAYARLDNFDLFTAETPWTTFATGCAPEHLGYWSPLRFKADRYAMESRCAFEYEDVPPFYALGEAFRVAAFDVPQVRIHPGINGVQVGAWGAHSPQVDSASDPPGLWFELSRKHGRHPGLHDDYAECLDLAAVERLRRILPVGIRRRADICVDLLGREPWDLFLTVFGEPHSAGHNMLQVSSPEHPLYPQLSPRVEGDPLREIYEAIDVAIARLVEAAGTDTQVVIFSGHGMGPNTMDLPSIAFLPELMFRFCFPGQRVLGDFGNAGPVGPPLLQCLRDSWLWQVWGTRNDRNPLRKFARYHAPWGLFKHIEPLLGPAPKSDLASPFALADRGMREVPFQPATWFSPLWPQMKAFALPSFSEGYVRINLKGREAQGLVDPADYHRVCDEIIAAVSELRDARSGMKMVRKVWKTRENPLVGGDRLPDADIVFGWQERHATDVVESPRLGRIGPLPHFRAGSHRKQGFALVAGDAIAAVPEMPAGHALDLAPTILHMMGAPIASHLQGTPLSIPWREGTAAGATFKKAI